MRTTAIAMVVATALVWSSAARADAVHARVVSNDVSLDGRGGAVARQTIPIDVDPGWALTAVEPPWDVSRGGQRDDATRAALTIGQDGQAITVERTERALPGTYRVALRLVLASVPASRPASGPAVDAGAPAMDAGAPTPATVDVTLNVTVAAPTVEATKAIDVEIVDAPIFAPREPAPLVIEETSNHAGVHGLRVDEQGQVLQDGKATSGAVTATLEDAAPIAPHGAKRATLAASGTPLGASDATVRISADDLGTAVTVAVHITHRRAGWVLLLVFAVGMAIGFAVRIWAQRIVDVDGAAATANDTLDALREISRRARAAEQQRAADAATKIRDAARTKDKAAIDAAVAGATVALGTIASSLATQVQDLRGQLDARSAVVGLHALPAAVGAPLDHAAAAVDAVETALIHTDVAAADDAMAVLVARIDEAREALDAASSEITAAAAALVSERDKAVATVIAHVDAIDAQAKAIAAATAPDQLDAVQALTGSDRALRVIDKAIRDADAALGAFAAQVRAQVAPTVGDDIASATVVDPGDRGVVAMIEGLAGAIAATYTKVLAAVGGTPPAGGDFLTALIAAAPKPPATHVGLVAPGGAGFNAFMRVAMPAAPPSGTRRAIATVISSGPISVPGVSPWVVAAARGVRWAATAAMLTIGVWYVYSDSFIGTTKELVALGATGFFTDVSFSAASAIFGKLKKGSAT